MGFRIAMVGACPFPVPQGSQVLLRDTAAALQEQGHEVHLVVYGHGVGPDPPGLTLHRCMRVPGVRKTAAGPSLLKPIQDVALARTLRRVVRTFAIDIVHAHNYEGLLAALAAGRRPIVYLAHNAMVDELPYFIRPRRFARLMGGFFDRCFPHRADHVIVPHHALAEYLLACGCPLAKLSVLAPPCDAGVFDDSWRPAEGVPPILYTGNLDAYQNLDLLVRAFERVRREMPGARLRVATASPGVVPRAEMTFTPDFAAARRELAEDAVVVCPRVSWSGYPIKLLNAMAAGRAVVVCRSASHPVTHGHDGLVVEDNDEEGFAREIARLLRDAELRHTLGRNARKTIRERHQPASYAAAIETLYAALLDRKKLRMESSF